VGEKKKPKKRKKPEGPVGFARLSAWALKEISRRGGLTAAKKKSRKKPHRFTPEEAARAARIGHKKTPGPRNPRGITGRKKEQ